MKPLVMLCTNHIILPTNKSSDSSMFKAVAPNSLPSWLGMPQRTLRASFPNELAIFHSLIPEEEYNLVFPDSTRSLALFPKVPQGPPRSPKICVLWFSISFFVEKWYQNEVISEFIQTWNHKSIQFIFQSLIILNHWLLFWIQIPRFDKI